MFRRNVKKERWNLQTRPGPNTFPPELFSYVRKRVKYFSVLKYLTDLAILDECGRRAGNTNPAAQQCCRENIKTGSRESRVEWHPIPPSKKNCVGKKRHCSSGRGIQSGMSRTFRAGNRTVSWSRREYAEILRDSLVQTEERSKLWDEREI